MKAREDWFRRAASGDWWDPDDEEYPDSPRTRGRVLFLEVVRDLRPDVLRSLYEVESPGRDKLTRWARRWHLDESWVREHALTSWAQNEYADGGLADPLRWYFSDRLDDLLGSRTESGNGPGILFAGLDQWYPTDEKWADYKSRILATVEERLEEHRKEVEQKMDAAGFEKVKRKRARIGPPDFHFRWTVRLQVPPTETQEDIASDPAGDGSQDFVSVRTVSDKTNAAADLIGLTLRTAK